MEAERRVRLVVVMGVAGAGKTTVGRALAARLAVPYADGDSFHAPGSIAKMASGRPLDDADRAPWLSAIADWLSRQRGAGAVVSCSALRRSYREQLRAQVPALTFLHLAAELDVLRARMVERPAHFMPLSLLPSQLATLEPLAADEPGVTLDAARSVEALVAEFLARG
jgi:gluconokinase